MDKDMIAVVKFGLLVFSILYVFSPIDAMPGIPFDDILVLVLQYIVRRRLSAGTDT